MKCHPWMRVSVRPCVSACMCALSYFKFKLNFAFVYEDIFTTCVENVYGCENTSVKNFVPILKNNMAAIADCWKIVDMF